ncbi:MAG: response regulator [Planctomycetota bacterium]
MPLPALPSIPGAPTAAPARQILVLAPAHHTNGRQVDGPPRHATDTPPTPDATELLEAGYELTYVEDIAGVVEKLRTEQFAGVFCTTADFLPLERALAGQQAAMVLNTVGEGVCVVAADGRLLWQNQKMHGWSEQVQTEVQRACREAAELFRTDANTGSRRNVLRFDEHQQFLEIVISPLRSSGGELLQIVAVVWDATQTRRLQQKIDTIDAAGRELVRLESDAIRKMNMAERLKLLEHNIVRFTHDLLHFDHFAIRLIDRKNDKLELVVSEGLPDEALAVDLYKSDDRGMTGISGFVAATGRSYICNDVDRDPRYVVGLDGARSSLTVPLQLHDRVIGVFNIESRQPGAFTEDDRQFAEIFGRYVAMALNILELMVTERVETRNKMAGDVAGEIAGPLNDIAIDVQELQESLIGDAHLSGKLDAILANVESVRGSLRQAMSGPQTILGAKDAQAPDAPDPAISRRRILVVDDEPVIRETIGDVLRKYDAAVTIANDGNAAIERIEQTCSAGESFDLIVSDIRMPDRSGYDVFAAARKHLGECPVILMTGFGYDPNHCIVRASQEGLQAVLFKPFRVDKLLDEVRRALTGAMS